MPKMPKSVIDDSYTTPIYYGAPGARPSETGVTPPQTPQVFIDTP
jgi:hypothetical protein